MLNMNFRPYTKEDKLEVGTKFDFAGRKGVIVEDPDEARYLLGHKVAWEDGNTGYIDFTKFTNFLVKDIPPKPLTIDKRVKDGIWDIMNDFTHTEAYRIRLIKDYLNSLEEY